MTEALTPHFGVVSYSPIQDHEYFAAVQHEVQKVGARVIDTHDGVGEGYAVRKLLVSFDHGIAALTVGAAAAARAGLTAGVAALPEQAESARAGTAVVPGALLSTARKLLILDVDSTLIKQEVIDLLATHAGREAEVAAVTEAAMHGELDFAQSLYQRVAVLAGLPESVMNAVGDQIELSEGAESLVQAFLQAGHAVAAVSGGFTQILDPLAARLQLTFARANQLGISNGILTGTVEGPVVDRAGKEQSLRGWAAELGISMEHTIAVGDGANDLDMLAAAGLGVAFNAKPAVRALAGAALDLPQLDVVQHFVRL